MLWGFLITAVYLVTIYQRKTLFTTSPCLILMAEAGKQTHISHAPLENAILCWSMVNSLPCPLRATGRFSYSHVIFYCSNKTAFVKSGLCIFHPQLPWKRKQRLSKKKSGCPSLENVEHGAQQREGELAGLWQ